MPALSEDDPMFIEACEVFDKYGYRYMPKLSGSMMWVVGKDGTYYSYYPTTGRWGVLGLRGKHYRSKGPLDFLERFVVKNDLKSGAISLIDDEDRFGPLGQG